MATSSGLRLGRDFLILEKNRRLSAVVKRLKEFCEKIRPISGLISYFS